MTAPAAPTGRFSGKTLLAVFAHPDDESITCGGTLVRCAALGARVALLCVTRGEAGPSAAGIGATALAAAREEELRAAATALGISSVELLDHQDGMLPWTDTAVLDRDIRQCLDRVKPDVVVTFGADGLYWHPDHIAVHERVTAVVRERGDDGPALYYATVPEGAMRAVFDTASRRAAERGGAPPRQILGIGDPDAFGSHAAAPTLIVDVSAAVGAKLAALRSHASQLVDDALSWVTPEDTGLLATEHFHRAGSRTGFIEGLGA